MTGFFFGFFVPSQKAFWLCFPVVSGQGFLASGCFFLACVTHPICGPGSALLGVVSPIPFLGQVRFFWVWSPGPFLAFFPCVYSVPGFSGLFLLWFWLVCFCPLFLLLF